MEPTKRENKAGGRTGPGLLSEHPHLFREIVRTQQALVGFSSRGVGMPWAKLSLMRQLAVEPSGELGVNGLARRLGVTPAAVTRTVQYFEGEGLIARRDDPRDGRRSYVRLTAKGKRALKAFHERAHALEDAVIAGLPPEDVAAAVRVLAHVRAALEERRDS